MKGGGAAWEGDGLGCRYWAIQYDIGEKGQSNVNSKTINQGEDRNEAPKE